MHKSSKPACVFYKWKTINASICLLKNSHHTSFVIRFNDFLPNLWLSIDSSGPSCTISVAVVPIQMYLFLFSRCATKETRTWTHSLMEHSLNVNRERNGHHCSPSAHIFLLRRTILVCIACAFPRSVLSSQSIRIKMLRNGKAKDHLYFSFGINKV